MYIGSRSHMVIWDFQTLCCKVFEFLGWTFLVISIYSQSDAFFWIFLQKKVKISTKWCVFLDWSVSVLGRFQQLKVILDFLFFHILWKFWAVRRNFWWRRIFWQPRQLKLSDGSRLSCRKACLRVGEVPFCEGTLCEKR